MRKGFRCTTSRNPLCYTTPIWTNKLNNRFYFNKILWSQISRNFQNYYTMLNPQVLLTLEIWCLFLESSLFMFISSVYLPFLIPESTQSELNRFFLGCLASLMSILPFILYLLYRYSNLLRHLQLKVEKCMIFSFVTFYFGGVYFQSRYLERIYRYFPGCVILSFTGDHNDIFHGSIFSHLWSYCWGYVDRLLSIVWSNHFLSNSRRNFFSGDIICDCKEQVSHTKI